MLCCKCLRRFAGGRLSDLVGLPVGSLLLPRVTPGRRRPSAVGWTRIAARCLWASGTAEPIECKNASHWPHDCTRRSRYRIISNPVVELPNVECLVRSNSTILLRTASWCSVADADDVNTSMSASASVACDDVDWGWLVFTGAGVLLTCALASVESDMADTAVSGA